MVFKEIVSQFNLAGQCRKYGLSLWQCPQFLFLLMGGIIIVSSLATYAIGARMIADPEIVALIVISVTSVLFIIAFIITQSFDKLAEANRMKSEFVSVVSHQLRSPISNLKWAIEFLLSGRAGEVEGKQLEYFRILKENSTRMQELVADLLTVSRIESAGFSPKKTQFSLEDLVSDLYSQFEPLAKASNVEMKFVRQEGLPQVIGDPSQIRQAIDNLIDNAVRYVKEKGIVEISLSQRKNSVYLSVKDNGVGIPDKDKKYIFQKFFRSENALRYQTEGSGLGLYIAKSFIEKSGGRIGFASQEGKGSTFWLVLPSKQK
ncbi:MAG: HAMP domain-containing histidine kinase [Candidatus Nealsonbacteria bacterium]|nr:HAMP domain-containing histidine kinase [Candidatus Nealsonbacteria bacterium]